MPVDVNISSPKVGIVILNWNNYADTARLLQSMQTVTYASFVTFVVDNGSTDTSIEKLREEFTKEGTRFVLNGENLGFAAGCNRGIDQALAAGCDYVLLLNNDCIAHDPGFLDKAVALAEADTHCGIVGGKILFWPETNRIWSTGGYIKLWGAEKHIGHGEWDKGQYQEIKERKFISGALMLIKREVLGRIGMLPEEYFFGKEEWEYSTRAIKAGFKLLYCPSFTVYHEASHSHSAADPTYVYNGTLSKILYKKRNHSAIFFYTWLSIYWFYLRVLYWPRVFLQRGIYQRSLDLTTIRRAMLMAVRDSARTRIITRDLLDSFRQKYYRSSGP